MHCQLRRLNFTREVSPRQPSRVTPGVRALPAETVGLQCPGNRHGVGHLVAGVSSDERGRALAATALGEYPERIAAFNAGFTGKTAPMSCLTDYLE